VDGAQLRLEKQSRYVNVGVDYLSFSLPREGDPFGNELAVGRDRHGLLRAPTIERHERSRHETRRNAISAYVEIGCPDIARRSVRIYKPWRFSCGAAKTCMMREEVRASEYPISIATRERTPDSRHER